MHCRANRSALKKLIESTLEDTRQQTDNILAEACHSLNIGACAIRAWVTRRCGRDTQPMAFIALVWPRAVHSEM